MCQRSASKVLSGLRQMVNHDVRRRLSRFSVIARS
jgi:hypothetical protein